MPRHDLAPAAARAAIATALERLVPDGVWLVGAVHDRPDLARIFDGWRAYYVQAAPLLAALQSKTLTRKGIEALFQAWQVDEGG